MNNSVPKSILTCRMHLERPAELHCKTCGEHLCAECSLDHSSEHEVVLHTQEAINFARSFVNKSFTVKEEEAGHKEVLQKFDGVRKEHEGVDKLLKEAVEKLGKFENEIGQKIGILKRKSQTIAEGLDYLKKVNEKALVADIKGFLSLGDYQKICQKKAEFSKIANMREKLNTKLYKEKTNWSQRKIRVVQDFLKTFSESDGSRNGFVMAEARFVGILSKRILLYDLIRKRKYCFKPKNVKFNKCCEGIEVNQRIFFTGGKNDNKDTYELCLDAHECNIIVRANMIQGRCNHALAQLAQKVIYCAGGVCGSSLLDKCEKYDIESDTWTELPSLNQAKHNGAMCGIADRYIYFIGGGEVGHKELFTTIEMLDTAEEAMGEWSIVDLVGLNTGWTPCECINAVAISKDEIMMFGGWEKDKDSRSVTFVYNHRKKTLNKTSSQMKRNSAFFYRVTPAYYGGKVYAMSPDENIHMFSLKSQEWAIIEEREWKEQLSWDERKKLILTGRIRKTLFIYELSEKLSHAFVPKTCRVPDYCEGVVVGKKIFLVGGENCSNKTYTIDVCSYEGELEVKADMNVGRYNHALEQVAEQFIYCCGGFIDKSVLAHCEKYSIQRDKWYVIPPLTEAKQNLSLCNFNNRALYSIGGGLPGHNVLYSTIEKLDLQNEERGWEVVPIFGQGIPPLECVGSAKVSAHGILLFGGWKLGRQDSGKCYEFDAVRQRIIRMPTKLENKTGFYYSLKPVVVDRKVYVMDPDFNINIYDTMTKCWEIIYKHDWKHEEEPREGNGCALT